MAEILAELQVQTLGVFSVTYDGRPLSFAKNTSTKAMKLLQILLYYSETGIARERLLDHLFGFEEMANSSNNLRVTVHRLKKILHDAGLPEYEYINIKKGIYKWESPMKLTLDVFEMRKLLAKAEQESDEEEKMKLLEAICHLYRGTFLPDMAGADWALVEDIYYKNLYSKALTEVCEWKIQNREYESALKLCTPACEMYPFDEWQSIKIECYIGMNHYKEALKEYEDTAKLFFEELGISPSEKMMKQFEKMSRQMNYKPQDINEITNGLREEAEERGAFYCSYPSFRDSYRLLSRIMERNGQSVYLMICSITNGKGKPIDNEEKLELMSQELHWAIKLALRRGDSFTKYNPSQFLLLLVGTNKENCTIIFDRILKNFTQNHKSWGAHLEYYVSSAANVEVTDTKISFKEKKSLWD